MASLYEKQNSPFWFVQFIDADGTRRNKSTGFRADNPGQTVKARALRAQLEAKELSRSGVTIDGAGWDTWVPQFLERHCQCLHSGITIGLTQGSARTSGAGFQLNVEADASAAVVLEYSSDLIHWTPLATNAAPHGLWPLVDMAVPLPSRFYRTYHRRMRNKDCLFNPASLSQRPVGHFA